MPASRRKANNVTPQRAQTNGNSEEVDPEKDGPAGHSGKPHTPSHRIIGMPDNGDLKGLTDKSLRKREEQVPVGRSLLNIVRSSCVSSFLCFNQIWKGTDVVVDLAMNMFIVFLPISWVFFFYAKEHAHLVFACKFPPLGF